MKLFLVAILVSFQVSLASDCVKRTFSQNSFVCVCNNASCDSLNIDKTVEPDHIAIFETDLQSLRLERTVVREDSLIRLNGSQFVLTIDRKDRKQPILGFGATFTDGAVINTKTLPNDLVERLMQDYFGPTGLEYSLGRVPIGGSDSSTRAYSLDDSELDFDLSFFELAEEDTKYRIPLLRMAKQLNPLFRSIGSAWSAPAWMKVNHALNGAGGLIWRPGDVYYKLWAKYYVKYLNAYKDAGAPMHALTTGNEPVEGFRTGYAWNALAMTPEELRDFVKLDLGPTLLDAGWGKENLSLLILDDNTSNLNDYIPVILDDAKAAAYVDGIAYHWYSRNYPSSYQTLASIHDKYDSMYLISTEGGWTGVASEFLGSWDRAEGYAIDILEGLQHWSTGWIDWAFTVDIDGGPNWAKNWVDAAVVINATAQEYYKNPMFYVMAHFSKFLNFGTTRVGSTADNAPANVHTGAFTTVDQTMVLIMVNTNNNPIDVTIKGFAEQPITTTLKARSISNMVIPL